MRKGTRKQGYGPAFDKHGVPNHIWQQGRIGALQECGAPACRKPKSEHVDVDGDMLPPLLVEDNAQHLAEWGHDLGSQACLDPRWSNHDFDPHE